MLPPSYVALRFGGVTTPRASLGSGERTQEKATRVYSSVIIFVEELSHGRAKLGHGQAREIERENGVTMGVESLEGLRHKNDVFQIKVII